MGIQNTVRSLRAEGLGWTLVTISAGWLLFNGFRVVLPALLPQIRADFAITNASAGFAFTVLWLMYAGLQFPAGIVADRVGEEKLLLLGALLGAFSLGSFYITPGFALFVVACAVFGGGAGLFGTPRDMFLTKMYPDVDSTAYGVTFAAGSLGAAALPVIATTLATRFGWRIAVVSLVPFSLGVVFGLHRFASRMGGTNSESTQLTVRETVYRTALSLDNHSILLASGGMLLFIFTYQALIAFLPTYLIESKGFSQSIASTTFGLMFVFGAIIQVAAGHIADHYSEQATVLVLSALATVTLIVLPWTSGVNTLVVLVPLLGIRIAIGPITSAYIVRELPETVQGTGWGLLRTIFFGIGSTGSTVIGVFADAGFFDEGFLVLAALTAVIFVFWLLIPLAGQPTVNESG